MKKIVLRSRDCLRCGGDYVTKQWDRSTIQFQPILLKLNNKKPIPEARAV
jgi:hypothetical protein